MSDVSARVLTGQSRVVSNVVTSWGSYLIFFVAGFLLPHLIDRQLGQSMLGMWDFAWSLVNYLALSSIGIASNLNRFVANHRALNEPNRVKEAASTVFVIQVLLALVVLAASAGIAWSLPTWIEQTGADLITLQWVFFILGSSLAVQFLFDTSRGVLTGCHRWDLHSLLNAGTYAVAVMVMMTLLFAGFSLVAIALTYLAMQFIQGVLRHRIVMTICPEAAFAPGSVSMAFARTILVYGGKSILIMISPVIIVQTTYFLVMTNLGPALLAILARPMSLVRHIESFLARFTNILIPMAGSIGVTQDREDLQQFALLSARFGFAFTLPIIGVFCIYGDEVIRIWMGDDYVERAIIVVLGLGYLLPLSQTAIIRVLTGINEHGRASVISVVGTLLAYGLTWIWVRDSASAVSYAILIVLPLTLVNGLIVPLYACRRIGLPISRYFLEGFFTVLMTGGVATGLLWMVDEYLDTTGIWIFVNLVFYALFTSLLYWKFILTTSMRQTANKAVKGQLLGLAARSGLLHAMLNRHRETIPVITIHGVADEAADDLWRPTWQRCSTDRLDAVMSVLSRHYQFISLDEMVEMLAGRKPVKPNCMVITFDDGYENNLSQAMPVLQKYAAPLSVFVSTRMLVEREPYWIDRLDYALTQLPDKCFRVENSRFTHEMRWADQDELAAAYKSFREAILEAYDNDYEMIADIELLLDELEGQLGRSLTEIFEHDKWSALLTAESLGQLPPDVTIGSHTINHVRVDRVDDAALRREMTESKQTIESLSGKCDYFCYPQGVYSDAAARMAKEAGYLAALTGESGTNRAGDDLFKLKRVSFPGGTTEGEVLYHVLRNIS
ncbi:MAG: polysaccharide deacetylase family protein [Pseudomonadota bacterium]